jgi:PQQ-like domain
VGLPVGTAAYPDELIQGGKDGRLFVLNRDNLGGRGQGPDGGDAHLFYAGRYGKEFGHPAVYEQSTAPLPNNTTGIHDYVYYVGKTDYLRAFQLSARWNGAPALTDVANSTIMFGASSGSPVVTSYGTNNSSVVVWAVDSPSDTGAGASLQAFAGMPQSVNGSLQLRQIWSAPIGTASKFTIPATSNGMVYVGTRDGDVLGFGTTTAPLSGAKPLSFGPTSTASAATAAAALTAAQTVTVTRVSVTDGASPACSPSARSPKPGRAAIMALSRFPSPSTLATSCMRR